MTSDESDNDVGNKDNGDKDNNVDYGGNEDDIGDANRIMMIYWVESFCQCTETIPQLDQHRAAVPLGKKKQ